MQPSSGSNQPQTGPQTASRRQQQYNLYSSRHSRLLQFLQEQIEILHLMHMPDEEVEMQKLLDQSRSGEFKVIVVGDFNRGKSTLINAMLGEEILPAFWRPTTAIINIIQFGTKQEATIFPKVQANGYVPPAFTVPIEELSKYTTIDQNDEAITSPYEKIIISWPLELLQDKVSLIDSPGLNDQEDRQMITLQYIEKADAVIFLIGAQNIGTQAEMKVIQQLHLLHHDDIFFVCNGLNLIPRAKDAAEAREYFYTKIAPKTKHGGEMLFVVNALQAMEARITRPVDTLALEQSGIDRFEEKLAQFLTDEKGRLKIVRPAQTCKDSIRTVRESIQAKEAYYATSLAQLYLLYDQVQEPLRNLEQQRIHTIKELSVFRQGLKNDVHDSAMRLFSSIHSKVPMWVQHYTQETNITVFRALDRKRQQKAIEEILAHLQYQMNEEILQWQRTELTSLIADNLSRRMLQDLQRQIEDFERQAQAIENKLMSSATGTGLHANKVKTWERVVSVMAGVVTLDPVSGTMGMIGGVGEYAKTFAIQVAIVTTLFLVTGTLNPLFLIPGAIIALITQGAFFNNRLTAKIKEVASEYFQKQLQENRAELSAKLAANVDDKLKETEDAVNEALRQEVLRLKQDVLKVINDKERGEQEAEQGRKLLGLAQARSDSVERGIDDLIKAYALNQEH